MQTDHEKLEEIITNSALAKGCGDNWIKGKGGTYGVMVWADAIDLLATAILKEFVSKDRIEVDEQEIYNILAQHKWDLLQTNFLKVAHILATKIKELIK